MLRRAQYLVRRFSDLRPVAGRFGERDCAQVAGQLFDGYRARQHDIDPGIRDGRGDRHNIGRAALGVSVPFQQGSLIRDIAVGQPPIGDGFLDDHAESERLGVGQRRASGRLEEIPRRLNDLEKVSALRVHIQRAADGVALFRSGDSQTNRESFGTQPTQFVEHSLIVEHSALNRRRVNVVKIQPITKLSPAFEDLSPKRFD